MITAHEHEHRRLIRQVRYEVADKLHDEAQKLPNAIDPTDQCQHANCLKKRDPHSELALCPYHDQIAHAILNPYQYKNWDGKDKRIKHRPPRARRGSAKS
ncbi:MAG: hypothetical protein Q4A82_00975 [Corynebacterium sp.]|nr:hypothetical protein [Corynebacterium sp.]